MIKFFRKIRQKLLSENKFSKYFLYAIGEIVLVVIGILIALQINNWNQNRINTQKEIIHFENILSNLNGDLENQILPCIKKTESQIKAFYLLKTGFFENDNISNDSIRQLFFKNLAQWDLILNTVAFENLKSSGMDIITNDSIKMKLLTLYGNKYQYIKNLQSQYNKTHYERVSSRISYNNIDMWDGLTEEDKIKLFNDKHLYLAMKSEAKYSLGKYLRELKSTSTILQELIGNIKKEVIRLREK